MNLIEAIVYIVGLIVGVIAFGVIATGRWPWQR